MSTAACAMPVTVNEAARILTAEPETTVVGGGTDLMPLIAAGRLRPRRLLSLRRIAELRGCRMDDDQLLLGASLTYSDLQADPIASAAPVLAAAARTVGSLQVRNLGTIGGALVTAAPAGDLLPALLVTEATAVCAGPDAVREVPVAEVLGDTERPGSPPVGGSGRAGLAAGEIVAALRLRRPGGPGHYLRVARRGGPTRAMLTLALAVDVVRREVRCAAGGLTPVPFRSPMIEAWLAERVDWRAQRAAIPGVHEEFGLLLADHALARGVESGWRAPGADDEHVAYLHRALTVAARRALRRVLP